MSGSQNATEKVAALLEGEQGLPAELAEALKIMAANVQKMPVTAEDVGAEDYFYPH